MPNVLIRNVEPVVVDALKQRAASNERSLQQELHAILGTAVEDTVKKARRRAYYERAKAFGDRLAATGRDFGDSTLDIRDDRDTDLGRNW